MDSKIEIITPEMAEKLMADNNGNRKISKAAVNTLASAITRGEWKLNGTPVVISKEGRVLDGQHRLMAIINSKEPISTFVVRGVSEDVFDTLDIGRKRTIADTLYIIGEKDVNVLAATIKIIKPYFEKGFRILGGGSRITPIQAEKFLLEHPDVRKSVAYANCNKDEFDSLLVRSAIAAFHYIFTKKNEQKGNEFMESFRTGANLDVGSPILALRRNLSLRAEGKDRKPRLKILLMVKAWNSFIKGEKINRLRASEKEKFPEVLG